MGGEGGSPEPGSGGSSAGEAPIGMAGMPMSEAGTGGAEETNGGAAGAPPVTFPEPELLFTVKPGALGLADSALSTQANAQNVIYTSSSGSQDAVDGTNAVKVTGVDLGLAETDQIVAFALPQAEPKNPLYLFSVADGSEGGNPTRLYQSYWQESGTEEGDVYYSDGTQSFRYLGEGGDQFGYNAMTATEVSLGLSAGDYSNPEATQPPDDITGLAVHDARQPITELYFTVSADAAGAADSAVATVAADERSCTVFKSSLDGTNSVAFSCADLGLATDDQIDGLAVYGDPSPSNVVFSVSGTALGAVGTAVRDAYAADDRVGSMLFQSEGNATNTLLKTARDLGLSEYTYDEIDGLAVVDAPEQSVAHAASCTPTYDPLDATNGGELTYIGGTAHIGPSVVVVFGQTAALTNRLIAYSTTTCALLQQKDIPVGGNARGLTIVPLAGWTPAKPLDKVEYWRVEVPNLGQELRRYDDAGVADDSSIPINGTEYSSTGDLIYEPVAGKLYTITPSDNGRGLRLGIMPIPAVDSTAIDAEFFELTSPCNQDAQIAGTDGLGNVYLAQLQRNGDGTQYRVCIYSPHGELLPASYTWTSDTAETTYNNTGFIVPGAAHYLFHLNAAPFSFERSALSAP